MFFYLLCIEERSMYFDTLRNFSSVLNNPLIIGIIGIDQSMINKTKKSALNSLQIVA